MKTEIKINRVTLTQKEIDTIIEDKNTINLSGIKSTKQKVKNKLNRILFISLSTLFIVLGMNIQVYNSIALEVKKDDVIEMAIKEIEEKEEVEQKDLDNLIDIIQESVTEEVIIEPKKTVATDINVGTKIIHKTDDQVIQETIKFLHKFEGVRLKAYWDYKQYSICYGTPSFRGEVVTQIECDKRLSERVKTELLRVNRIGDNLAWNKKVALISFFYNVGYKHNILNYAKRGDDKSVIYLIGQYNMAGGKYLQGLQNRRNSEIAFYKG